MNKNSVLSLLSDEDYYFSSSSSSSSSESLSEQKEFSKINFIKNYEIRNQIGRGAFATVYFAHNLKSDESVALKKVRLDKYDDDELMENCKQEIQFLNRIKSANVIRCFESFYEKNYIYISLEFADDIDLETKINIMRQRGTIFSERKIWYYFHQICNGLKDIHHAKILHRDLKPANIFMCKNGVIKIGDLGLACLVHDETKLEKSSIGTEYYKAPERLEKDGYHFPSDIWSLGCLLYELCTFRSPFSGELSNAFSLHKRIKTAEIIQFPMNIYSEPLNFLIFSCLNIYPDERPSAEKCHFASRRMYVLWEKMFLEYKCGKIV